MQEQVIKGIQDHLEAVEHQVVLVHLVLLEAVVRLVLKVILATQEQAVLLEAVEHQVHQAPKVIQVHLEVVEVLVHLEAVVVLVVLVQVERQLAKHIIIHNQPLPPHGI